MRAIEIDLKKIQRFIFKLEFFEYAVLKASRENIEDVYINYLS